ncbi:unnamed protein product [Paramecium sonneborni]|uniref:Uncharacterized protein n=1 Tax=Paramecium sonneborni TaxID=65129 RepID=A0A8S1LP44_9CILI|nr:unnamed protein product [Paramecium sonneborni]
MKKLWIVEIYYSYLSQRKLSKIYQKFKQTIILAESLSKQQDKDFLKFLINIILKQKSHIVTQSAVNSRKIDIS